MHAGSEGYMVDGAERTLAERWRGERGEAAGQVTSGTFSPVLERGIGLGYVRADLAPAGSTVDVVIRGKEFRSQIVNVPFIRK